jgi:hypothetical protein
MTHTSEKCRMPGGSNVDGDSKLFPKPMITDAPVNENDTANHKPEPSTDETRQETRGSSEASRKGMSMHLAVTKADFTPVATIGSCQQPQQLVSVNQSDFTIEVQPTRSGHICRTCDMMVEVTACLCGSPVESESRNSKTAVQCGYKGCETLWVSVFHPLLVTIPQLFLSFILSVSISR